MIEKKHIIALTTLLIITGMLIVIQSFQPTQAIPLEVESCCGGIVEKKPGESFTVKISFKNKGITYGHWGVAITFEGDYWTWKGEERILVLDSGETETITWEGTVPGDAPADSIGRLVVYYGDSFELMRWWIQVVSDAELGIVYSRVS
jgi:hypothetical protein